MTRRRPVSALLWLALVFGCEAADVGVRTDAEAPEPDAGRAPDAGPSPPDAGPAPPDAGPSLPDAGPAEPDAGEPTVLFEELFDDDAASSRWRTNTPDNQLVFAGGVATSPASCPIDADCPEGPAVAYSRAIVEMPSDDHFTFEVDFLLAENASLEPRGVQVSLGVDGVVPRVEEPCGASARCFDGFELLFMLRAAAPSHVSLLPLLRHDRTPMVRSYDPEPDLRADRWYRAIIAVCGLDGIRVRIRERDGPRTLLDAQDRTGFRAPDATWYRQNVYIEGQGLGNQLDRIRVTAGALCD